MTDSKTDNIVPMPWQPVSRTSGSRNNKPIAPPKLVKPPKPVTVERPRTMQRAGPSLPRLWWLEAGTVDRGRCHHWRG